MMKIIVEVVKRHQKSLLTVAIGLIFSVVTTLDIVMIQPMYYTLISFILTISCFIIAWMEAILKYEMDLW